MESRVELLSPAGDYECFLSAINAGADAVYLSGDSYGARAYAKNFTTEEIISALNYAHLLSKKVYLTVNTVVKNSELDGLFEFLLPLYENGLDGVIVQDLGVVNYIRRNFKDLPVHASTQMAITGTEGVKYVMDMGITRAVLARELTLNEISKIYKDTGLELECFVHGALCYSYSGKCLFSSMIGDRSGNRGRCAGSCRQPYNGKYYLSTKDICTLRLIPELIKAGIASFKIEGRMKNPEYVAGVTSIYRKYIDAAYNNPALFESKEFSKDLETLTLLYTRGGNSEGYYKRHNSAKMISVENASYKSNEIDVKGTYNNKELNADVLVSLKTGENANCVVSYGDISINITGSVVLQAENKPITNDVLIKQFSKTGDSLIKFKTISSEISDDAFLRVSELNELRRKCIAALSEELLKSYKRKSVQKINIENDSVILNGHAASESDKTYEIIGCANSYEQLNAICESDYVEIVSVPFKMLLDDYNAIFTKIKATHKKLYVSYPYVIRYDFYEKYKDIYEEILNHADGIYVDNLETIYYLRDDAAKKEIKLIGDIHLYCLNAEAKKILIESGLDSVTVPVELNKKELLRRNESGEELIVYGRLPMMVSAQCVNNTMNGCNKKETIISLKDRTKANFYAENNCSLCQNVIYNGYPVSLHGQIDFIKKIKPSGLRFMFITETYEETKKILSFFEEGGLYNDDNIPYSNFTKGHFNRGVL